MKIGMLTSGGDCQGLNAALRAVVKALRVHYGDDASLVGFVDGYRGLINGEYRRMTYEDFSGILTRGGTILGTSRQPFKLMRVEDETGSDKVAAMKRTYAQVKLDCLVILGGNGTHKTANLLRQEGLNVVTLPKTIDNDIYGTDMTFGFQSAVDIATDVIDRIHSTATSHGRVFIVEIMGNKVGWMTLYAGIGGGADVILLPEIPYDLDSVARALKKRADQGRNFSVIAAAEGILSKEEAAMPKKQLKAIREARKYPVSYSLAEALSGKTGQEIRVTVPGHFQRGGAPSPADKVLCTRLGAFAGSMIITGQFGCMAALRGDKIVAVPLAEVAGVSKPVPPDCDMIKEARSIGVSFGDEN